MAKFDWYEATFHQVKPVDLMKHFEKAFDLSIIRPIPAKNGYTVGNAFFESSASDRKLVELWWEGNPGVHVKATGDKSPLAAQLMRDFGNHNVTRVDACEDWIEAGLFNRIAPVFRKFALEHNISINMQGDWERGKARTLYLGSRESTVQLCLYEKGYQMQADPDWVRLEVRVKPKKDARLKCALLQPGDIFGCASWLVQCLACIGWDHLKTCSVGTVYRPDDEERARNALAGQYAAIVERWVSEVGSWENFGLSFTERLAELQKPPEKPRAKRILHLVGADDDS